MQVGRARARPALALAHRALLVSRIVHSAGAHRAPFFILLSGVWSA